MSASEPCVLIATCLAVLRAHRRVAMPGRWIEHRVPSKRPNRARHFAFPPTAVGSTRNPAEDRQEGELLHVCLQCDQGSFAPPEMKVCRAIACARVLSCSVLFFEGMESSGF